MEVFIKSPPTLRSEVGSRELLWKIYHQALTVSLTNWYNKSNGRTISEVVCSFLQERRLPKILSTGCYNNRPSCENGDLSSEVS